MALYLLNISVDAPDAFPNAAENLNYNDMESVVEILLEQVLSIEDAVPEHDDPDRDHGSSVFGKKLLAFVFDQSAFPALYPPLLHARRQGFCPTVSPWTTFAPDVVSPPPEA